MYKYLKRTVGRPMCRFYSMMDKWPPQARMFVNIVMFAILANQIMIHIVVDNTMLLCITAAILSFLISTRVLWVIHTRPKMDRLYEED